MERNEDMENLVMHANTSSKDLELCAAETMGAIDDFCRDNTPHWRVKKINATEQRSKGFCPLTPTEVGVFLRSLGYPESTRVYIAAGEIYGGSERMSGFLSRFPHVMSKVNHTICELY